MATHEQLPKQNGSTSRYSYSGSDFTIWAYYQGVTTPLEQSNTGTLDVEIVQGSRATASIEETAAATYSKSNYGIIKFGTLQTISGSSSTSMSAVHSIGSSLAQGFTEGSTTFAGSLIFTLLDKDPLTALMQEAAKQGRTSLSGFTTTAQLPPFNIVVQGMSEYNNQVITKVFVGVKLMAHGEVISIDDFFVEQTYQHVCSFITPWMYTSPDKSSSDNENVVEGLKDLMTTAKGFDYEG